MSVLGDRYEYDVFFSYAWGTASEEEDLRNWTHAVAVATTSLLRLRFNGTGRPFERYLDRVVAQSGEDLDVTLKRAVERSGVFVAFISTYYNSPYCQKEVEWFCEGHGLKGDALADRVCLIRIQHTPPGLWPSRFNGTSGKPLLYKDLCGDDGQPKSIEHFSTGEKKLSGLGDQIKEIALEIADKISGIAARLQAQEAFLRLQARLDRPLFFFEAEPTDQQRWAECGRDLQKVPSIVLPPGMPKPATAISPDDDLKECDGILMLRSRSDDDFSRRIRSAYLHRRKLFRERRETVPWVLLDDVDPAPLEEQVYDIPRVKLDGDWIRNFQEAMRC